MDQLVILCILYFNYGLLSEINMDGWMVDGWMDIALSFVVHARRSGMDHTVLPAITPVPAFAS